ncbi:MAG: DHH family phosphoesterase [Patescibacteria group bacterium]
MLDLEQQIFKQIEKAKSVLIVFPANWDGDAVASALALFLFLKRAGQEVDIAGWQAVPNHNALSFLPAFSQIQTNLNNLRRFIVSLDISQAKVSQIKYTVDNDRLNFIISPSAGWFKPEDVSSRASDFKYDLIVTIGASDLETLDKVYDQNIEFFYKTTIINIDQQSANEEYGQINFIDLNAVAISEILFYLLKNYKPEFITEDIATCLLTGIISKTKNFKTANLTPRTLLTTSQLISLGARREEIVDHLYRSRDISVLKLWGRVLNNLKEELNGQLIWSRLKMADFQETKAADDSLADIVDELIANVPNAKIIVILREDGLAKTKIILYSLKNINALEFLKEFNPRGTIKVAQAEINQDLDTATVEVIARLKIKLDKHV